MIEAVIVFPLFIIVFAALIYYHQAYSAKIERSNVARRCAWAYSVGGCIEKPKDCPIGKIGGANFVDIDEGVDHHGDLFKDAPAGRTTEQRTKLEGVLGASNSLLTGLLGLDEGIEARPSRDVKMPSLLGGATRKITGNYAVMCNERSYTNKELVKASYCAISGSLPGCK